MFLNAQLLKFDELRPSCLQIQTPSGFVGDTFLTGAHDQRCEARWGDLINKSSLLLQCSSKHYHRNIFMNNFLIKHQHLYRLIGLRAALVTCVRGDGHHGFDLRRSGYDASDRHKLTNAVGLNVTHHFRLQCGWRFEIHLTDSRNTDHRSH